MKEFRQFSISLFNNQWLKNRHTVCLHVLFLTGEERCRLFEFGAFWDLNITSKQCKIRASND